MISCPFCTNAFGVRGWEVPADSRIEKNHDDTSAFISLGVTVIELSKCFKVGSQVWALCQKMTNQTFKDEAIEQQKQLDAEVQKASQGALVSASRGLEDALKDAQKTRKKRKLTGSSGGLADVPGVPANLEVLPAADEHAGIGGARRHAGAALFSFPSLQHLSFFVLTVFTSTVLCQVHVSV